MTSLIPERESHGEAVAVGMYQITRLAQEQCLTAPGNADRILKLLKQYGLPYECGIPLSELTDTIELDKKNLNDRLNVVLLREIGNSYIHPATIDFFKRNLRTI